MGSNQRNCILNAKQFHFLKTEMRLNFKYITYYIIIWIIKYYIIIWIIKYYKLYIFIYASIYISGTMTPRHLRDAGLLTLKPKVIEFFSQAYSYRSSSSESENHQYIFKTTTTVLFYARSGCWYVKNFNNHLNNVQQYIIQITLIMFILIRDNSNIKPYSCILST